MKQVIVLAMSVLFVFGILFPVSRTSEGPSPLFEAIKKFFHYGASEETERPKAKKYPTKFEKTLKKQIRYPSRETETK